MNSFGNFKFLVGKNDSHSEMRILGCDTLLNFSLAFGLLVVLHVVLD
jgi:hypothetical protein